MICADIYNDMQAILGACQDATLFSQVTRAVETLANEKYQDAAGNWRSWDALEGYATITVQSGNLLVLPDDVETPIRLSINNAPAMSRDKLFEFMPNGPGSAPGNRQVTSFQDQGASPTYRLLDGVTPVKFRATVSPGVYITGYDAFGARVENYVVPVAYDNTQTFLRIDSISKPGTGVVALFGTPMATGAVEAQYSVYGTKDNAPAYRVLRLSTSGATVRMLYRRKTFKITSQQDYIPLNSELAVLYMAKAIRRGLVEDFNAQEQNLYLRAVDLLTKEQLSRHAADLLAQTQQIDRTMGRNPNAGDLVTVYDVYDDLCEVFGPVGQDRIFEWLTEIIRILGRKSNWDSLLTYVVTPIVNGFFSLPAEIDSFLRINVDNRPVPFRDKLFEFSLNGPGSDEVPSDVMTEDRLDSPLFAVPATVPFQLSTSGTNRTVTISGRAANGDDVTNFVLTQTASDCPQLAEVSAVQVSKGANAGDFISVLSGGNIVARYGPNDTTPIYRRIAVRQPGATARVLARRKTSQVYSLNDFIPLRSREALVLMAQSIKAARGGDVAAAGSFEQLAVQRLSEEQLIRSSAEGLAGSEQVNRAYGMGLRSRDVLTVGDIYDDCAALLGPVGMQQTFDAITQAVDLLQNASEGAWDSQQGFADLLTGDGFTFALPAEVGDILAVNICGQPARPRNRWMEYHLNGPGQFDACCQYQCVVTPA